MPHDSTCEDAAQALGLIRALATNAIMGRFPTSNGRLAVLVALFAILMTQATDW
jgi:hypothetical protein